MVMSDETFVKVNPLESIDEQNATHSPGHTIVTPHTPVIHQVTPHAPPVHPVVTPPHVAPVNTPWQPSLTTEAGKIWASIKLLPIHIFGLSNQVVENYCFPVNISPDKLYLASKASAVLPALETTVAGKFVVELQDKYIVVTPAPTPLTPKH
jgi:hypothetical protein